MNLIGYPITHFHPAFRNHCVDQPLPKRSALAQFFFVILKAAYELLQEFHFCVLQESQYLLITTKTNEYNTGKISDRKIAILLWRTS